MFDLIRLIDTSSLDWFNANIAIRNTIAWIAIVLWFAFTLYCFVKVKAEFFAMFFGTILFTAFAGVPTIFFVMGMPATTVIVIGVIGGFLYFCVSVSVN